MRRKQWFLALAAGLFFNVSAFADVTVRFGEQDTCKITGVATVTADKAGSQIKFDLAKLPANVKILDARLRLWVQPEGAFALTRWNEQDFDGFKCFQAGKEDQPLDVCFPFEQAHYALQGWDVTSAVKEWVANPGSNQGLRLNCPLPSNTSEPAWRRPYLQVTYAGDSNEAPPAPSDLKAFYRGGQVFLTWKMPPYDGAFFDEVFRVYMHTEPVTAANLSQATLVGEANRNSNLNYRRTVYYWDGLGPYGLFGLAGEYLRDRLPKDDKGTPIGQNGDYTKYIKERYNFVIDDKWYEKNDDGGKSLTDIASVQGRKWIEGPELPDDTGLFVHTVKKPGNLYFAVTTAIEGQENRKAINAGNSLAKAIEGKVEPPIPVLQFAGTSYGKGIYPKHYRVYTHWGGGDDGLHNTPSTPCMLQILPPQDYLTAKPVTKLVNWNAGDLFYPPPTPRAPFPSLRISLNPDWGHWIPGYKFYYGSKKKPVEADKEAIRFLDKALVTSLGTLTFGNYYGWHENFNTGRDPRKAVVYPYAQNRILREIDMYLALFPAADRNQVHLHASSRPAMSIAMQRGDRIATLDSSMDAPWTAKRLEGMWPIVGKREWALKVPEGFSVWDWNDPIWFSKQFPLKDWAFVTTCISPNYDRSDDFHNWQDLGYPDFFKNLEAEKRAVWMWWCQIGDAPGGGGGFSPLNEAVPAFSSVTCSMQPQKHHPDEPNGTLNGYIEWHHLYTSFNDGKKTQPPVPLDLIDEASRFEVALRIRIGTLVLNGNSVPSCQSDYGMTDVTLRRLQKFNVEKGKKYAWKNVQVSTGRVLQSGVTEPDKVGRLTIPQVFVDRGILGNKLIVVPGSTAEKTDTTATIALSLYRGDRAPAEARQLDFAEYVAKCKDPEMIKKIKPGRVFGVADLAKGGAEQYSTWGAGFSDAFLFPDAGRYRVEVSFRRAFKHAGAWPTINCSAALPERQDVMLDSDKPKVYSWWIDIDQPKARRNVDFKMNNRTFNSPAPHTVVVNGKETTRGFTLESLTFVPLGKRPDKVSEVFRTYIVTRSIETGVNLPVQVRAEAQDAWGEALDKKPAWTASEGAAISADGVFSASAPGTYTVTAAVDGKNDAVPVVVAGDAWVENFDDMYEDGWTTVPLDPSGKDKAGWYARSIHQYGLVYRDNAAAPGALVWDGGYIWRDYSVQADRLSPMENRRQSPHSGLVFRYTDKDNFYRFEKDEVKKSFRLIKVVKGRETELANATKDIAPISMAGEAVKDYPTFKYYPKDSKYFDSLMKGWSYDRFKVEVKGDKIVGSLNNVEVLTATDGDLKGGTIGLFCDGSVRFDNISVKTAK